VAALYLDRGLVEYHGPCGCKWDLFGNFVHKYLLSRDVDWRHVDPMGTLAQAVHAKYKGDEVAYKSIMAQQLEGYGFEGFVPASLPQAVDKSKVFVEVWWQNKKQAVGWGKEIKEAKKEAAYNALLLHLKGLLNKEQS